MIIEGTGSKLGNEGDRDLGNKIEAELPTPVLFSLRLQERIPKTLSDFEQRRYQTKFRNIQCLYDQVGSLSYSRDWSAT